MSELRRYIGESVIISTSIDERIINKILINERVGNTSFLVEILF